MPTQLPVITGVKDPKALAGFKAMLHSVGVPKGVTQIIVGNPIEFEMARKAFGIQDSHPAFSVYNMGRVYIPDEALNNPNLINQYLLHEFGHYAAGAYNQSGSQQNLSGSQRMAMEQAAERGAQPFRDAYKLYRSPAGRAYQAEQSRIDSDAGKIQSVPVNYSQTLDGQPPKLSISNLTQGSLQGALHGLAQK